MDAARRKEIQDVYVRLCRDARFRLPMLQAARLTGAVLKTSALEVWAAMGTDAMERIANGTHPCLQAQP